MSGVSNHKLHRKANEPITIETVGDVTNHKPHRWNTREVIERALKYVSPHVAMHFVLFFF